MQFCIVHPHNLVGDMFPTWYLHRKLKQQKNKQMFDFHSAQNRGMPENTGSCGQLCVWNGFVWSTAYPPWIQDWHWPIWYGQSCRQLRIFFLEVLEGPWLPIHCQRQSRKEGSTRVFWASTTYHGFWFHTRLTAAGQQDGKSMWSEDVCCRAGLLLRCRMSIDFCPEPGSLPQQQ